MHWMRPSLLVEGGGGGGEGGTTKTTEPRIKSIGIRNKNGNKLHQNVTPGKLIKPRPILWEESTLNKVPPLLNRLLYFEGMLLRSRGLNTYWPYGYQLIDFLLPFLPPRRTPPWLPNGGRTAGRLLLPRFPLPRLPLPGLPPERPPGRPPERPPGRRRNPPGRPFRNLGSGYLFSKSKTSLSSPSLSSFSSSMSASGSFL